METLEKSLLIGRQWNRDVSEMREQMIQISREDQPYLGKISPGKRSRATSAEALKWKRAGYIHRTSGTPQRLEPCE